MTCPLWDAAWRRISRRFWASYRICNLGAVCSVNRLLKISAIFHPVIRFQILFPTWIIQPLMRIKR